MFLPYQQYQVTPPHPHQHLSSTHPLSRGNFAGVDHDQQFHQVVVHLPIPCLSKNVLVLRHFLNTKSAIPTNTKYTISNANSTIPDTPFQILNLPFQIPNLPSQISHTLSKDLFSVRKTAGIVTLYLQARRSCKLSFLSLVSI